MSHPKSRQVSSLRRIRSELVGRLRERLSEIEEAIFARVQALSETAGGEDAEYTAGLRAAVTKGMEYILTSIERDDEWLGSVPPPPLSAEQAWRAARNGVSLDTVLRRYAAGDRMLGEFIMEEAQHFPSQALRQILRAQGLQVDRLMAFVATEYMHELERMRRSPTQRRAEQVERLLAGDGLVDVSELNYDFDAWHLSLVVRGAEPEGAARRLAADLDCQILIVPRGSRTVWAWLGGQRHLSYAEVEDRVATAMPEDVSLAVGEPRRGVDGWRLTHHEAQAALQVMLRTAQRLTRGSDVVLLAAVLRDESLARSLIESYLTPLDDNGDFGLVLRETLRAYFATGLNAAATAAALGVDRHTVQRRLRKAEEALDRLLPDCHAALKVALDLEELDGAASPEDTLAAG
jgi:hypothetical protein